MCAELHVHKFHPFTVQMRDHLNNPETLMRKVIIGIFLCICNKPLDVSNEERNFATKAFYEREFCLNFCWLLSFSAIRSVINFRDLCDNLDISTNHMVYVLQALIFVFISCYLQAQSMVQTAPQAIRLPTRSNHQSTKTFEENCLYEPLSTGNLCYRNANCYDVTRMCTAYEPYSYR